MSVDIHAITKKAKFDLENGAKVMLRTLETNDREGQDVAFQMILQGQGLITAASMIEK